MYHKTPNFNFDSQFSSGGHLHKCLECGKPFYDMRSHLKKHKMTLSDYNLKHDASAPQLLFKSKSVGGLQ